MNGKHLLKILPKPLILLILVVMIISSFDGVVLAAIVSNVSNFTKNTKTTSALAYIGVSMLAMLTVYGAMVGRKLLENKAIKIMNIDLKENYIYSQLHDATTTGDAAKKVSKIFNDFKLVETNYFSLIFESLAYLLTAVVSAVYILYLNIPIGLLFIVFSLLPTIVPKLVGKGLMDSAQIWQNDSAYFLTKVNDLFSGLKTIKIYSAEKNTFTDTLHYLDRSETSYKKMNDRQCWATLLTATLSVISFLVPLGVGLLFITSGAIEASVVIGIFLASDRVVGPLRGLIQNLNTMKTTQEIRATFKEETLDFDEASAKADASLQPLITFDKVTFAYPKAGVILQNASFEIPYLDKILLTGPSGAGKTTILNLIQGLLKPTSGAIKITAAGDKVKANEVMAYIQQAPFLFNDTLKFNLTFGREFTDHDCKEVLQQVGLVDELGDDLLEQRFGENGDKLSGGQRQRIEIARALLYQKKIILIDEATANLDNEMSAKINQILGALPCTVIEVAHHFDADAINDHQIKHYALAQGNFARVN
ncbi:ATP-binding cassette domain-containing protein [Lapidilactobacillus luobeiensis]|uniref:ATP-binding cassette domain-containing protein n=1 Tax=Lapidilactobacillus luobeiensis TaxID=2950371 RepID=UPI0021C28502|nr:ABC transporter ATP-binding protein [Lapidilactobacillus luobeiensis]